MQAWTSINSISRVTFKEIMRERVLYNIVGVSLLLLFVCFYASKLTFIRPDRVIMDFGISSIDLTLSVLSILLGSSLISKEFERRTVYLILSRSVTRGQFVVGKFLGLLKVCVLNWILLCGAFFLVLTIASAEHSVYYSSTLYLALFFILLQTMVVGAVAVLFSTFTTSSLAMMMSTGLYMIGQNSSQLKIFSSHLESPSSESMMIYIGHLLKMIAKILPNYEHFNLGTKVAYGLPVTWQFTLVSIGYAIGVTIASLTLGSLLIERKEV